MELTARQGADVYVRAGAFRQLTIDLCNHPATREEIPAVVVACCDRRARMLPFNIYDRFIFPAGARAIAGTLHQAGFRRTRAVYQLWNPAFRPSQARLDGRPPQLLLLSSMGINSSQAYALIADAWQLGANRPLILVGGPKAIYQPYDFWPIATPQGQVGPDAVITGEAYVLLELLQVLLAFRRPGEHLRAAFERARRAGALDEVPGLVYLAPEASWQEPALIDTGLQRLVQNFDEFPDEVVGLSLLEPPHRGSGLAAAPIPADRVRRHAMFVAFQMTQGCKFSCPYCPIPAVNQKTWRFRSADNVVRQFRQIYETFRIKFAFGSDDNFMNRRQTVAEIFEALARATVANGRRLGHRVRWAAEATQCDTYKNRDLLPLGRQAGLSALWFGIEDLTAELINKGQKPEKTQELFQLLHAYKIAPMAMIMYHDGQPLYTSGSLYGLWNQVQFLRRAGAISLQCTIHGPALGTKEWGPSHEQRGVLAQVGSEKIADRHFDGNHVLFGGQEAPWLRQLKWLGGYWGFYNPLNLLRAISQIGTPLWKYRLGYQLAGMYGAFWTTVKTLPYLLQLMFGKLRYNRTAPPLNSVPVELAPNAFPRLPLPLPRRQPSDQAPRAA